ncbi:MAG: hypothetical protein KIT09_26515 [Bryobacteraceae bacterium]|nr:hypothetical protein [Bryobacteraceae bacterium]
MWDRVNQILSQSADRISANLADILPKLIALLIIILLAVLVAWLAKAMVRRSLGGVRFDQRLDELGFEAVSEVSPARSPSLLLASVVYWLIIVLGLLLGLRVFDPALTQGLISRLLGYLPELIAAGLILMVGAFLARFLARSVLISAVNMNIGSARLLSLGVKWLVVVLAGAMALEHLGIGRQIVRLSFAILFGGIVLALALAVGLGSKDVVTRSLERQASKPDEEGEKPLQHL